MVSNYDRVYQEIQREAQKIGASENISPNTLVKLAMEVVDIEDRNRIRATYGINQQIAGTIRAAATGHIEGDQEEVESNAEVS